MTDDSHNLSLIIPVYNDPQGIDTTLSSIADQRIEDLEVLVVDNDSTDTTPDIIQKKAREYSQVKYLEEKDIQSSYAARNTGIKRATGEILLFLDADMWVDETWVKNMVEALRSGDHDYLGCNVETVTSNDPPTFWERYEQAFAFPVENYLEQSYFIPTCALAVRREVFESIGQFDERLESSGDKEFGQRVHEAGFSQGYVGSITAYHPARDSFEELRSKARRIGRGRAQMRKYHPEESTYPHPLHPFRFLPPSPRRLSRQYSGQNESLLGVTLFYLLEYILKLTESVHAIRELS